MTTSRPIPMVRLLLIMMVTMSGSRAARAQVRTLPPLPEVTLDEGRALLMLARSAMQDYLLRRTGTDQHVIPKPLQRLAARPYTVAVLLRQAGQLRAREVRSGASLPRNVIAAALVAMRSPRLPDRITQELLDTLTVEIEILGGPRPVPADKLIATLVPGATGLMATRAQHSAYTLVSTTLLQGMTPAAMRRTCLAYLGLPHGGLASAVRWSIFTTKHFVGQPNGRVLWLQRGKILLPREAIDARRLSSAALETGLYLASTQQANGQYLPAPGQIASPPPGQRAAGMADHLYATWVLADLAARADEKDRKRLSDSVAAALAYAGRSLRPTADAKAVYLATADTADQFEATAWMALILARVRPVAEDGPSPAKLRAALLAAAKTGRLRTRLDGLQTTQPSGVVSLRAGAVAILALTAPGARADVSADELKKFTAALKQHLRSHLRTATVADALWWHRTGLELGPMPEIGGPAPLPRPVPVGADRPSLRDEIGGFGSGRTEPTTEITALTALALQQRLGEKGLPASEAQRLAQSVLEARRFCYQMSFKPDEAYFAAKPSTWVGAVRDRPGSAHVSLQACAAAIEAFLLP